MSRILLFISVVYVGLFSSVAASQTMQEALKEQQAQQQKNLEEDQRRRAISEQQQAEYVAKKKLENDRIIKECLNGTTAYTCEVRANPRSTINFLFKEGTVWRSCPVFGEKPVKYVVDRKLGIVSWQINSQVYELHLKNNILFRGSTPIPGTGSSSLRDIKQSNCNLTSGKPDF